MADTTVGSELVQIELHYTVAATSFRAKRGILGVPVGRAKIPRSARNDNFARNDIQLRTIGSARNHVRPLTSGATCRPRCYHQGSPCAAPGPDLLPTSATLSPRSRSMSLRYGSTPARVGMRGTVS